MSHIHHDYDKYNIKFFFDNELLFCILLIILVIVHNLKFLQCKGMSGIS